MIRTPTGHRSSNIAEVDYDAARGSLDVVFKSGGRYRYHGVTPAQHDAMLSAESIGRWYNDHLWGQSKNHPSEKIVEK